jgi:predicted lipoprotein with Yx(FWY)xxD motif
MVRSVRSVVLALGVLAGAAHVGAALAQVPAKVSEGVLTNGTGMTLYFSTAIPRARARATVRAQTVGRRSRPAPTRSPRQTGQ